MVWWRKAYSALTSMQARGILSYSDKRYVAFVKTMLGL